MTTRWPQAAVFDLDGLLVDTQACWHHAISAAVDGDDAVRLPAGASIGDAARVFRVPPSVLEHRLLEVVSRHDPQPLPGALLLLDRLRARIPLALASNSPRSVVENLLERLDAASIFTAIVTVDDVSRGKPAPDVYVEACRLLAVDPSETIAFEDSSIGARAARAAGAVVIGVPPEDTELPEADLVVSRLDDSALLTFLDLDEPGLRGDRRVVATAGVLAEQALVARTAAHVRSVMEGDASGHDWWHVQRVWSAALVICSTERADRVVVELGALLHDLADWKFNGGDLTAGPRAARSWLNRVGAPADVVHRVCDVVAQVSFKSAETPDAASSIEAQIVQDADRLDAIGAIGIARAFAYGGYAGNLLHNPEVDRPGTTVNHFHEKLLLLRDRMHTEAARQLAAERHAYLEQFLERFLSEWAGDA